MDFKCFFCKEVTNCELTSSPIMKVYPYKLRNPSASILYKVISENLETFLALVNKEDGKGVPSSVLGSMDFLYMQILLSRHFRERLECLCRCILRPAIALDRLWINKKGNIIYKLKKRWLDSTSHVEFTPMEFMEKLAALVPSDIMLSWPPHFKNRNLIAKSRKMLAEKEKTKTFSGSSEEKAPKQFRMTWAMLHKRTFNIDIEICPWCKGKRKVLSAIIDGNEFRTIHS